MDDYLATVIRQAQDWDDERPRTKQKEIGWSGMTDCRARIGFRLAQEWATDDDDKWAAIRGTALHLWLTMMRCTAAGIAGEDAAFDIEVSYGGISGHVDEVNYTRSLIVDWKSASRASAKVWDDPDVLAERATQVHGYAAGVLETADWHRRAADPANPMVGIMVMPVEGGFADWRMFTMPFDRDVADAALRRYASVVETVLEGGELPRDKHTFWCQRFCEFFTACRGGNTISPVISFPEILDAELAAAVERYGEAAEVASEADRVKRELAPMIRGLRGYARGWKVFMSRAGQDGREPDIDAITAFYAAAGAEVPMKTKPGAKPKLIVQRGKP